MGPAVGAVLNYFLDFLAFFFNNSTMDSIWIIVESPNMGDRHLGGSYAFRVRMSNDGPIS